MTTFANRAISLANEIEKLDLLKKAAHALKDYQSRRERLQAALAKLGPPADFLALLAARELAVLPGPNPVEDEARTQAAALVARFAADPSVVLSADFGALIRALTAAQEQFVLRAHTSWKSYATPLVRAISKELLDALERIDAFRMTVKRIRTQQVQIEQLAAKEWVTELELDGFVSLIGERATAWDELQAGGAIPDGIVEFLKQCNKGGVRLDAGNGEALEWLRTRGILGCFRIVL